MFEEIRDQQEADGLDPYAPFEDEDEWGLVKWLVARVGQTAIDEFLKLPITRRLQTSFKSKHLFMKAIDKLPRGTEWNLKMITVEGDLEGPDGKQLTEELELWLRDPVDCIREMMANPAFAGVMSYAPEKVYVDETEAGRRYDEMWTGDWWWEMQGRLPEGAVVTPVILASDKTSLSQFKGDKQAWPVYLTIGNIAKDVRRQLSKHATVLLGYLPVSKLECFSATRRQVEGYRLYHYCMSVMVEPLVKAGTEGVCMMCPDGFVRRLFPILAALVADHPEQCLVACCRENRCPKCTVDWRQRGELVGSPLRTRDTTLENLQKHQRGELTTEEFEDKFGMRAIYQPFWADLPHSDIFESITPDILHQLHKGVFKDHIVNWCTELIGKDELDSRFKSMTDYASLRHFKAGISKVKQWTGTEHKEMEHVFLGAIAGAVNSQVMAAVRGVLDFIYYSQYQSHTSDTLNRMQDALTMFHDNKDVFVELGIREHFNIPKVHSMLHYIHSIKLFGSADGFNTESPERLHIDFAKRAYRASNRRDYVIQMTTWLRRQESIYIQEAYLAWLGYGMDLQAPDTEETDSESDDSDAEVECGTNNDLQVSRYPPTLSNTTLSLQTDIHVRSLDKFVAINESRGYYLPSTCPHPNTPISRLIEKHGASEFMRTLEEWLQARRPNATIRKLYPFDRVDVYKYISLLTPPHPHISDTKRFYKLRVYPEIPGRDARQQPTPAHFDTAVIIENENLYTGSGISGELSYAVVIYLYGLTGHLVGLRIGQVKVIFTPPRHFATTTRPLAYIHWFRPLQAFDTNLSMFRLVRSSRHRAPNAAIVPVDRILRPCHLIPRFGAGAAQPGLTAYNALDTVDEFYLNRYIDFEFFERLN
ncbi:hypothetical protein BJ138DRAFT_1019522 [Hygrophoropsis aurantiaca]|uniref:Uncharacterized protein n=1 Tax=Hygrophoropsis aurantiaca TaxID=72124 RepID=A0ACB7ZSI3_9AGAM|nr:hypothetical protein BJ138DRAFT_1019522 [Hygrophoropsis aurantiaca]